MATAKRLPSGSYRVRIFSHKEGDKKIYKSFTAETKKAAELMAAEYANGKREVIETRITVKEAVEEYIKANENVLSPATLYGYECELKRMKSIHHLKIDKITTHDVQLWISELSTKFSAKTVKNTYGLLTASVAHFAPDKHFRVNLPKASKKRPFAPNNTDVSRLYREASPKLKLCISLAAFHSLRRGEIAALKFADLEGNRLHVHADMVYGREKVWTYKEYPKTEDSDRFATLPKDLIEMIGEGDPDDYIVGWMPTTITKRFEELCRRTGIHIRFHDLRHFFASMGGVLNIPTLYLAQMGGWENSGQTMKRVYENKIVSMEEKYAEKMNRYFNRLKKEV